jgi:hypothetical protein
VIILIFASDMSFAKMEIDEKAGGFSVITSHCYVPVATPLTAHDCTHKRVVEICTLCY